MSGKLRKPPVFYTTAQIRFNLIPEMAELINKFQRAWRLAYPDFSNDTISQFQLQLPGPGQAPKLNNISSFRWHFKNTARTAGYVLTNETITYHTTDYNTSEHFFSALLSGLRTLHDIVTLSYVETVAMRTLDAIIPDDNHDLSFFVSERLLGLYGQISGEIKQSMLELIMNRSNEQITSRAVILKGRVGISADLAPLSLVLKEEIRQLNGIHLVLDNDCAYNERFSYDIALIGERLVKVKQTIKEAFERAVTPAAFEHWR